MHTGSSTSVIICAAILLFVLIAAVVYGTKQRDGVSQYGPTAFVFEPSERFPRGPVFLLSTNEMGVCPITRGALDLVFAQRWAREYMPHIGTLRVVQHVTAENVEDVLQGILNERGRVCFGCIPGNIQKAARGFLSRNNMYMLTTMDLAQDCSPHVASVGPPDALVSEVVKADTSSLSLEPLELQTLPSNWAGGGVYCAVPLAQTCTPKPLFQQLQILRGTTGTIMLPPFAVGYVPNDQQEKEEVAGLLATLRVLAPLVTERSEEAATESSCAMRLMGATAQLNPAIVRMGRCFQVIHTYDPTDTARFLHAMTTFQPNHPGELAIQWFEMRVPRSGSGWWHKTNEMLLMSNNE